jgi:anti-sigma factor RsiW
MICEHAAQVHAYHDGELASSEIAPFESHLRDCADCRALLADLRRVSQLVAAAPMADMPGDAMRRMQQTWWAAQDRGVRRIASLLTAAAAVVMLATSLWSPTDRGDNNTTLVTSASWQTEALTPPTDMQDEPQDETIAAAQWIANDLAVAMR